MSAQEAGSWTAPLPLSRGILDSEGKQAYSYNQVLVADSTGKIHAFWATLVDQQVITIGNALFYSSWDGLSWSIPLSIFYSPIDYYWFPQVAIDQKDVIHLTWVSGRHVWHTQALASEAGQVRSWSKPLQVADEPADNASIAVAPDGSIHIVYCSLGREKHVAHLWSVDGENWSLPVTIASLSTNESPRMAVDGRGRLHVVYGELGAGTAVYYSQSGDNGETWSTPFVVDKKDERYFELYGPAWISVITKGNDEIHLVWDGAPLGQRWHQWSADGGITWTAPEQLSASLRGLTGQNALAWDATGRLHLFSMGIRGTAPYYASWLNGAWSSLDPIAAQGWNGEGPAMAINNNQIVVTWWEHSPESTHSPNAMEVWTSVGSINSSINKPGNLETTPTPLKPMPTRENAQLSATAPEGATTATLNPDHTPDWKGSNQRLPINIIVIIAIFPAFLLSGAMVFLRWNKRRR